MKACRANRPAALGSFVCARARNAQVALFFKKSGLPDWAVLALISMTPAIELRGGVPVGSWLGLSPGLTFVICVLGNMAPIAPMLLALRSDFFKARPHAFFRPRTNQLPCRPPHHRF